MGEIFCPRKLVKGVSYSDIECFTKNPVPSVQVADYLRVCTACIQHNRIPVSGCPAPDLHVSDTVVHPGQGEHSGHMQANGQQ